MKLAALRRDVEEGAAGREGLAAERFVVNGFAAEREKEGFLAKVLGSR